MTPGQFRQFVHVHLVGLIKSFCLRFVNRYSNVRTGNEGFDFNLGGDASDGLPVSAAVDAVDGCPKVGSRDDEVQVEVVVRLEGQRLGASLGPGPKR